MPVQLMGISRVLFFTESAWSLLSSESYVRRPSRLTVTPPFRRRGSGHSSVKATARMRGRGVDPPCARVSHKSVSAVSLITVASDRGVALEAGAFACGVIGAHYLGLGNDAVLLLREGVAVCRERQQEGRTRH